MRSKRKIWLKYGKGMKLTKNDMINTQIGTDVIGTKMRFTNSICLDTYRKI